MALTSDQINRLEKYEEFKERGTFSEAEFATQKAALFAEADDSTDAGANRRGRTYTDSAAPINAHTGESSCKALSKKDKPVLYMDRVFKHGETLRVRYTVTGLTLSTSPWNYARYNETKDRLCLTDEEGMALTLDDLEENEFDSPHKFSKRICDMRAEGEHGNAGNASLCVSVKDVGTWNKLQDFCRPFYA